MTLHPNIQSMLALTQDRERRYKGILIDPRHIVFVTMGPGSCEYLSLCYEDIPKDAHVIDVTYDWVRHAFAMTLWHESFDIVPDGEQMPIHHPMGVKFVRHLCCQPTELKHPNLPNGHNELFNAFVRDRRSLIALSGGELKEHEELDSWIKEYEKAYGVLHEGEQ